MQSAAVGEVQSEAIVPSGEIQSEEVVSREVVKSQRRQKIRSMLSNQYEGELTEISLLLSMTSNTQQSTTFGCNISKSIPPQPTLQPAIYFAPL